jgi:hypothetical protein
VPPAINDIPNPIGTANAVATYTAAAPTIRAAQAATAETYHNLETTPVVVRDYGSWSFTATRDWPNVLDLATWDVRVHFERKIGSVQDLKSYAESNNELAGQLAQEGGDEPVQVLVTFRSYMSPEEFNQWASALGIHPTYVELRVVYDRDPLYTPSPYQGTGQEIEPPSVLRIDCSDGDPEALPQARVDEALAQQGKVALDEGYKLREVKGLYFTVATVQAKQLPMIATNDLVFLADISYEWAVHDLEANEGVKRERVITMPIPTSVFPSMEQVGLGNFAK